MKQRTALIIGILTSSFIIGLTQDWVTRIGVMLLCLTLWHLIEWIEAQKR
jgi:cytochrome c biogenesis protein CcdA